MTVSANDKAHRSLTGNLENPETNDSQVTTAGRRSFLRGMGTAGLGTTAAFLFGDTPVLKAQSTNAVQDSINQILLAAVIAEDLATTFYYNGLVGSVITNASLAGSGGTAVAPTTSGQPVANVRYLRAALSQEITHANLLRTVGNFGSVTADPYQTFYFASDTFTNLSTFVATLIALENAFIGAYLNAVRELATLSARSAVRGVPPSPYGSDVYATPQLAYVAAVAASILGVESEHRALGRIIGQSSGVITDLSLPANNLNFEQSDGLTAVYHGSTSAVQALTPFLTPSTGTGFSLAVALSGSATVGLSATDGPLPQ